MRFPFLPLIPIILITAASTPSATAATLHVPADHPTIQSCIDAAVSGQDECVVAPGTYNELINFLGKAITLRSSHGPAVTIIDGTGLNGSVVSFVTNEAAETTMSGFTITNGRAVNGAGVNLFSASPAIRHNIISTNVATGKGGGIFLDASSPTIEHNIISGNRAVDGGGIYNTVYSNPLTQANVLEGNVATHFGGGIFSSGSINVLDNVICKNTGGKGAGIYVSDYSGATINNNTISNNIGGGDGGGVYLSPNSYATPLNNVITGNSSEGSGGGIYAGSSVRIAGNVIAGNGAFTGGGVYVKSGATIVNNTIIKNNAVEGAGLYMNSSFYAARIVNCIIAYNASGIFRNSAADLGVYNNCVYGNSYYDYSGYTGLGYPGLPDQTGINGNISADPQLSSAPFGNIHIAPDSPCRNTGNSTDALSIPADIDGEKRIQQGEVDIGADETDGVTFPEETWVIVRVSPDGDDNNDGSTWPLAKRSIQQAIDTTSERGGEVWVAAGTYLENIALRPFVYVYGGFGEHEARCDKRNWDVNITTIDGAQRGPVVTVRSGYYDRAIDGFRVTNGLAGDGGGVDIRSGSPTIANMIIVGNHAGDGGGLSVAKSFARIVKNTIANNSASYSGGGVNCVRSNPVFENNKVTGNTAANDGGGFYLDNSNGMFLNNTIAGNMASYGNGGGLSLEVRSSPIIVNNAIIGNFANDDGGAIYSRNSAPTLRNTILAFNSSGIRREYVGNVNDIPQLRYSCVFGNGSYEFSGLNNPVGSFGNISQNPMLTRITSDGGDGWGDDLNTPDIDEGTNDDYGDLRLQPGSPCINAGDPDFVPLPGETDLDGHARVLCGRVDMGAYETGIGDYDCNQSVNLADHSAWPDCMTDPTVPPAFQSTIENRQSPIGCEALDFNADGHVDLHDLAQFMLAVTVP